MLSPQFVLWLAPFPLLVPGRHERERVQHPQLRLRELGVPDQRAGQQRHEQMGDEEHPPALDGVGDRTAHDRQHEERH